MISKTRKLKRFYRGQIEQARVWKAISDQIIFECELRMKDLWVDGGMPIYELMNADQRKAVDAMPTSRVSCECCEEFRVKIGREKSICINCGHLQSNEFPDQEA